MKEKRKISTIILNIIIGILLLVVIVRIVFPHAILDVTGYNWYLVASGSMEPEIMTNDTVIVKKIDSVSKLEAGDIIIFKAEINGEEKLVIHYFSHVDASRVITYSESGLKKNPNDPYDPESWNVTIDDVIAVYQTKVASAGFYRVVRNPLFIVGGLIVVIGIVVLVARKKGDQDDVS